MQIDFRNAFISVKRSHLRKKVWMLSKIKSARISRSEFK